MGRLQTYQGKIRTKENRLVTGESCCCEPAAADVDCAAGCNDSLAAASYLIEISGITNGSCGSCSSYNGSYVVTHVGYYVSGFLNGCLWRYDSGSAACGSMRYLYFWYHSSSAYVMWSTNSTTPLPASARILFEVISPARNCTTLSINVEDIRTNTGQCDNSSATCAVTAL